VADPKKDKEEPKGKPDKTPAAPAVKAAEKQKPAAPLDREGLEALRAKLQRKYH
jgi:hypothetical protein